VTFDYLLLIGTTKLIKIVLICTNFAIQTNRQVMDRAIVHMDLDTFFVSCERLINSELNGIPLIIEVAIEE
jgi:hypothetical protein